MKSCLFVLLDAGLPWSPDNRRIVFTEVEIPADKVVVAMLDIATSVVTELPLNGYSGFFNR